MIATKERLMDLERTVDTLNGRLRDMQCKLGEAKGHSLTERLWKNLLGPRQGSEFMSAVCNRQVRPNTKMVNYVGTTTRH
ncbi:MAG TPA: hypothetical protein VLC51_00725 [Nitrospira sp.]|jgi:hypothetical protein|nr:hypothetical protein [Nitrospira sp.]